MGHERDKTCKAKMKKSVDYTQRLTIQVGFTGNCGKKVRFTVNCEKKGGSAGIVSKSGAHRELWEEVGFKFLASLVWGKKCMHPSGQNWKQAQHTEITL